MSACRLSKENAAVKWKLISCSSFIVLADRLGEFGAERESVVNGRGREKELLPGAASSTYGGRWG